MHRAASVGTRLLTAAAPLQLRLPVRLLRSTAAVLADFTVVVPHMSESISEGIVSELPKPIGSGVAVDDIVAVLETDKVRRLRNSHGSVSQTARLRLLSRHCPRPCYLFLCRFLSRCGLRTRALSSLSP